MKPEKFIGDNLDELTFDKRNKEYGAYYLRKKYKGNVTIALIISITFSLIIVAIPLILMYLHTNRLLFENSGVGSELIGIKEITVEITSPPESPIQISRKLINQVPVVVDDTVIKGRTFAGIGLNNQENKINNENQEHEFDDNGRQVLGGGVGEGVFGYNMVSVKPNYPGGYEEMSRFIKNNIIYPDLARDNKIQGTVYVAFVVERDGSITNINIMRSIGAGCDEESERVIKIMPKWTPGRQNNRSVRVWVVIPMRFKIVE
jgi:periplasmic protein TonB